ncbi:MAG: hypothetical protein AB2L12_06560 [Smithellaceae bacterium]
MVEIIFDKTEDWENRTLCIDESCIGVIGLDGKCTECGKPYGGAIKAAPCTGDTLGEADLAGKAVNPLQNQEIDKNSAPDE